MSDYIQTSQGAKDAIHETLTVRSVSLALCQVQDCREEKVAAWLLFVRRIYSRGGVAHKDLSVWQDRII